MKCVLALCALVAATMAYPDGAPESTCGDMLPQHGQPGQNSPSPYTIKLSKSTIRPGETVYVTLEAASGDSLKGFFIQGRTGNQPIGKFDAAEGIKLVNCGQGVATGATHTDNKPKQKAVVAWKAPAGLTERVIFYATSVRDGGTYWVRQQSSPLTVSQ